MVWVHPRECVRGLIDSRAYHLIAPAALWAGFGSATYNVMARGLAPEMLSAGAVLVAILAGGFISLIFFYLVCP
jgi:hypothetical protein